MKLERITIVERPHADRRALMSRDDDASDTELVRFAAEGWGITLDPSNVKTGFLRSAGEAGAYSPTEDGPGAFAATWATY